MNTKGIATEFNKPEYIHLSYIFRPTTPQKPIFTSAQSPKRLQNRNHKTENFSTGIMHSVTASKTPFIPIHPFINPSSIANKQPIQSANLPSYLPRISFLSKPKKQYHQGDATSNWYLCLQKKERNVHHKKNSSEPSFVKARFPYKPIIICRRLFQPKALYLFPQSSSSEHRFVPVFVPVQNS